MIAIVSAAALSAASAATSERVVQDRHTGLAIGGIDPVGYFTDAQAIVGLRDFEAADAGAIWRFRNEGNLTSFRARPDIYSPQFGGYDPVDMARGVPCAGNPRIWVIIAQKLYLFSGADNRDAFVKQTAQVLRDADARWPRVSSSLVQ